uniref:Uncharacterized protein ycf92 n=1 Tax=Porphyra purpurea TaxID=2787 RepID=YCF92_PORPU|nr:hypothetical protein PopuCp054 [Porphyra purpurea]P51239.1 RecName: Full=Uncharacterized protein ycf92 [Porphyra purpurea]AAC08125.1 ORF287 [Porphyra purpurea]
MSKFELIPYRLYLSQSRTWMHKIKAEVKIYVLLLLWISFFILSYRKLLIVAFSLIITSSTIKCNQYIVKKHFAQTLVMGIAAIMFSFSITNSYQYNLKKEQYRSISSSLAQKTIQRYTPKQITHFNNQISEKLLFAIKPGSYFFITIYSIKLVMITTSSENLALSIYKTKIVNQIFNNELLFIFLLSSHIFNNIVVKMEKITQIISLRGSLNLLKHSTGIFTLFFLISKLFFSEIIKESTEISQSLYTRNLNQENDNFLKIYTSQIRTNDYICLFICTTYVTILFLS